MTVVGWTDDRVEQLKKLWEAGLSASQIAAELGNITRNAVIGKVHRLGLSGRAKSPSSAAPRQRKVRPAQHMMRVNRPVSRGNTALAHAFEVEAEPDPIAYDALLLTSANAIRHGGPHLASLRSLDVIAVGQATADAARAAGFRVVAVGDVGVDELLASIIGSKRLLHLAGAARHRPVSRHAIDALTLYKSSTISKIRLPKGPLVALVHSPRAGTHLAMASTVREPIAIAAISAPAAAACGTGWGSIDVAATPDDTALLELAARLCQS